MIAEEKSVSLGSEHNYDNSLIAYLENKSYRSAEAIVSATVRYIPLAQEHNDLSWCKVPHITRISIQNADQTVSDDKMIADEHIPVFTADLNNNESTLDSIIDCADKLYDNYKTILSGSSDDVYFSTIRKFIKKISALKQKRNFDPVKLSDEFKKTIVGTILKNMSNPKLTDIINDFLVECGMEKRVLDIGYRIKDEDYDFLEEEPLSVPVSDPDKYNTVVSKVYDAYIFWYYDPDDECIYSRIIPGYYEIGRRRE